MNPEAQDVVEAMPIMTRDAYAVEILRCLQENGLATDDESRTIHHYLVT